MSDIMTDSGKNAILPDELAELRRAFLEIENLRFASGISTKEKISLESASVNLRDIEREIISMLGEEIAREIKASSVSLEELTKRIKTRTDKFSKLPGALDKTTDIILEVIDIARRIGREL